MAAPSRRQLNPNTNGIRFAEDDWQLGQITSGSFDAFAGPSLDVFNFYQPPDRDRTLILDPDSGEPAGSHC